MSYIVKPINISTKSLHFHDNVQIFMLSFVKGGFSNCPYNIWEAKTETRLWA